MKKIAEKVALVALVCVTLVFVLTTLLYVTGVIAAENSNVVIILMSVLTVVYAGLSAYLLYVNFSERENLKEILLFSDTGSATHTSVKVVKNIVEGCARQVEGIEVRHVRIRADEKGGFVAIVSVKATAENVTPAIGKLRELLADSFARTLNLTFSSINFNVDRLNGKSSRMVSVEAASRAEPPYLMTKVLPARELPVSSFSSVSLTPLSRSCSI